MKVKKNDNVVISSGKDRGKKGKVVKAFPQLGSVIVEGMNMTKKRQRATKSGQKGQTISIAMPIKTSSIMIFCSNCNKGVRVGSKDIGGKKVRICRQCEKEV